MARGSAKPPNPDAEIEAETDQVLQERLKQTRTCQGANLPEARQANPRTGQGGVSARAAGISCMTGRLTWVSPKRFAARPAAQSAHQVQRRASGSASGTFDGLWQVGVPRKTQCLAQRADEPGAGHLS